MIISGILTTIGLGLWMFSQMYQVRSLTKRIEELEKTVEKLTEVNTENDDI